MSVHESGGPSGRAPDAVARRARRRPSVLAACAAAVALGLAACAGGDAEPAASTSGAGGDVTIDLTWWGDASRADRYEQAVALFEADHPNIDVRTGYASFADYWTSRSTEAAGRSLPDVFQMDLAYLTEYSRYGHVTALDEYLGDTIDVSTVAEGLLPSGQYEGSTYGIPTSASTLGTFVNGPLLTELGVEVPDAPLTWDAFDDLLVEVSAAGAEREPRVYGSMDYTQIFWLFQIWLGQQGKALLDGDELGFEKADLVRWWERSAAVMGRGGFLPAERYVQLEGVDPVGAAETAVEISWDNFLVRFSEGPAQPDLTLLPVPADDIEGASGMFLKPGLLLSVAANSEHPQESALLVDFLLNDPRVGEIFGLSRGVPASGSAADGLVPDERDQRILGYEEDLEPYLQGSPPPPAVGFSTLEQKFVTIAQDVSYGATSVDAAVDAWFAEAELALAG